jgi:hypothetical protein
MPVPDRSVFREKIKKANYSGFIQVKPAVIISLTISPLVAIPSLAEATESY